jgi:hypothetical protein
MLHEITLYYVMYSVRYYLQFHVTAVGLGTYYPQIWRSACIFQYSKYLMKYKEKVLHVQCDKLGNSTFATAINNIKTNRHTN